MIKKIQQTKHTNKKNPTHTLNGFIFCLTDCCYLQPYKPSFHILSQVKHSTNHNREKPLNSLVLKFFLVPLSYPDTFTVVSVARSSHYSQQQRVGENGPIAATEEEIPSHVAWTISAPCFECFRELLEAKQTPCY